MNRDETIYFFRVLLLLLLRNDKLSEYRTYGTVGNGIFYFVWNFLYGIVYI